MQSHLKFRVAAMCGGVAILTALAVGVCADGAAAVPAVEVAGPSGEYDFGYMQPQGKQAVVFIVKNTLGRAMTIKDIKRECDCTAVSLKTPATVAPGQTLAVDVDFTAPKDRTNYVTRVMLFTDDPARPILPLTLRATVGLPLTFVPRRVNLGTLTSGQKVEGAVDLTNASAAAVTLKAAFAKGPKCSVTAPMGGLAAGKAAKIEYVFEAAASPGNYEIKICIETDSADQPQACLSVEYTVAGARSSR